MRQRGWAGARRERVGGKKLAQRDKGMLAVGMNESRWSRDCLPGLPVGVVVDSLNALAAGVGKGQAREERMVMLPSQR